MRAGSYSGVSQYNNYIYLLSNIGPAMARRGDRIRCTVMFDETQERNGNGQVPVLFTLNGRKIITRGGESQFFMNCVLDNALFPFIGLSEGSSVLTKVRDAPEPTYNFGPKVLGEAQQVIAHKMSNS